MSHIYHTIILGLGAMGSATLYQCAKLYQNNYANSQDSVSPAILGIDQFAPPHTFGSSHGETRVTRLAIGEGAEYVPLAQRSHAIWQEITLATRGQFGQLYTPTGGLFIASQSDVSIFHGVEQGLLHQTRLCAQQYKINHRELSYAEICKEFPQFSINPDDSGYYEDSIGFLSPENCIKAQLALAEKYGAEIRTHETVLGIKRTDSGNMQVTTSNAVYQTKQLVIAAGPWLSELLPEHNLPNLHVYRQAFFWFEVEANNKLYQLGKMPVFIRSLGDNKMVYGFPIMTSPQFSGQQCIKIGIEHQNNVETTPATVNREITEDEIAEVYEQYVKNTCIGVTNHCVKTAVCLYTVTPNWRFLIDFLPAYGTDVMVIAACSGHGFKHSAAIGEAVAQRMLLGKSEIDVVNLFGLNSNSR